MLALKKLTGANAYISVSCDNESSDEKAQSDESRENQSRIPG